MSDAALAGVVDAYGLTAMQQGMLYHSVAEPGAGVYVNQIVTPISGGLDPAALRSAWAAVVARHDTLRTAFVWDGLDDPLQVVYAEVEHPWQDVDLSAIPQERQVEEVTRILDSDRERGFDLAAAPLSRMLLIRTGDGQWEWVWSFHHLIADGWSAQILLDELAATYRALVEDRVITFAEPPPYRDFIEHYQARDTDAEQDHWTRRLAGFAEPLSLAVPGFPAEAGSSGHRTRYHTLHPEVSGGLAALARSEHVTLNTVFVAMWALIVARWSRTNDVVFGTTVAGRAPGLDSQRATGLFINTLPTRVSLPPARRLGAWLNEIQRGQLDDRRHELASLADIQRWSDIPAGQSLFDSILVFENYPPGEGRRLGDRVVLGSPRHFEQSNYPLAVLVIPGDRLTVGIVHDKSTFSDDAVDALFAQVEAVARAFVADPQATLSSFRLVDPTHEGRIAALSRGPDLVEGAPTVLDVIQATAARSPDAVAVSARDRTLTYAELDAASSRLARSLARRGVTRGAAVGLHLHRSADLVVGIVGILKAAAAYVPLDPTYPPAHVQGLIDSTQISTIVTDSRLADTLGDAADLVLVDRGEHDDPATTLPTVAADDLAYVIHTSGSTGQPKGVMVSHKALAASTRARPQHYRDPVERFLLLSSYAFDSSVAGIFWTLTTGGALVLPEPGLEQDVDALLELAVRERITHTLSLPTLYQVLVEHAAGGELASLRVAIVAGEACPAGVLASHRQRVGHAELHNEYGPTEATVWCTVHRADTSDDDRALPIGRPIAGVEVHLLDAYGHRVPLGFAGELCVSGAGLADGYFARPDLTAERFSTVDLGSGPQRIYRTGDLAVYAPDGTLSFLGRTDHQLKIRGHRIESAAVEAELRSHPDVKQAVVVARPLSGRAGAQLVAYAVPSAPTIDPQAVRQTLRSSLPEYMVPDVLVLLEAIPHLPNGKVDVASLPDPRIGGTTADDGQVAPRTAEESLLADIWCDLLGVPSVGVQDDFFSLGGDSIVSIRMVSRARQAGLHIEPGRIAKDLTIEQIAANARSTQSRPTNARPSGPAALSPIQAWFLDQDLAVPDHWNQAMLFALPTAFDEACLRAAFDAILDHHDMLRARFRRREGLWQQRIDDEAGTRLERVSSPTVDVDQVVARLQGQMDLAEGPVVRGAIIDRPAPQASVLCVAAHHLVVDTISWAVLIEDLTAAYESARTGSGVSLPPRTTSFPAWTEHQLRTASDAGLPRWRSQLPTGHPPAAPGFEADRRFVVAQLDQASTNHLLTDANDAYGTRPEELIIAALPTALADASGMLHLMVEGHGRASESLDVSRTVGWFTVQYPLALQREADPTAGLKHAKEAIRAASSDAIDYTVARYIRHRPELTQFDEPSVLFNYLGRGSAGGSHLLEPLPAPDGSSRHPDNRMTHGLELVASIDEAGLTVRWYHSDPLRDAQVQSQADAHIAQLRSLIDHCLGDQAGGFTPSDFPVAGLAQDELDDFLDGLT